MVHLTAILPVIVALALSTVLTPVVRWIAVAKGAIAQPKGDRWHRKPTAMMGGVAIALTVSIVYAVFFDRMPHALASRFVMPASLGLFFLGWVDDVWHIKPYQKLIGQVLGAAAIIFAGLVLPWTPWASINVAFTVFWLIGITNAINLLDNMDGLAGGIAAIAGVFLAINLYLNGQAAEALLLAVFAATLVGFLVYNSNPASIFMGDCGSMFVGFLLASSALLSGTGDRSRSFVVVIAVPVLALFIPIFDTTLVTIVRKASGRAASQGGRDHTSHRLVALGLSERRAVWLLYGLASLSGLLGVLSTRLETGSSIVLITTFAIGLSLLGVYLAHVRVYTDDAEIREAREHPLLSFMVGLSYKRRIFEVLLDLVLVILASQIGRVLSGAPGVTWQQFTQTTAVLVSAQILALLGMGAYRGIWKYIGIENLILFAKAIVVGTGVGYAALRWGVGISELRVATFVLDGMVLLILVSSSRIAFRVFRQLLPRSAGDNVRRAIIFGAGDAGELLVRELVNNHELGLTPVGFVDDDRLKVGKVIHGLPVFEANGSVLTTCQAVGATDVVVSSMKISASRLDEVVRDCGPAGISVRRMRIHFDPIIARANGTERPVARTSSSRIGANTSDAVA